MPIGDGTNFITLNRSAPAASDVLRLVKSLEQARALQAEIEAKLQNMSPEDAVAIYGIETGKEAAFTSVMENVGTALNVSSVNNLVNNIS